MIDKVGRDLVDSLVPDLLQKALGNPDSKEAVQTVLDATVQAVNEAGKQAPGFMEGIQRDVVYGLSRPFEMGSTFFKSGKAIYEAATAKTIPTNDGQLGGGYGGRVYVHDLVHTGF